MIARGAVFGRDRPRGGGVSASLRGRTILRHRDHVHLRRPHDAFRPAWSCHGWGRLAPLNSRSALRWSPSSWISTIHSR